MCHCCCTEARQAASCNQSLLLQLGGSATVDQHPALKWMEGMGKNWLLQSQSLWTH